MNLLYILSCTFACLITTHLLSRSLSCDSSKRTRVLSAISAAVVFSVSTWSLYVLSMFRLFPDLHESPNTLNILLSLAVSVTGTMVVFLAVTHRPRFRTPNILAALIIGVSICATNYVGSAAFRRIPRTSLFYLDSSVALLCATFFTFIFLRTLGKGAVWRRHFEPMLWLSCAVLCSHVIEHTFIKKSGDIVTSATPADGNAPYLLALVSISVSFAILAYTLTITFLEQRHGRARDREIQRFQKLAAVTTECLLILDGDTVVESNNVLASIIGLAPGSLKGKSLYPLMSPPSRSTLAAALLQIGDTPTSFELDLPLQSGKLLTLSCTLRAVEYDRRQMHVLAMRDLSLQKAQEDHIRHLAMHDSLTALPNRTLFHERMEDALLEASIANSEFAVFYLDLDRFKRVNDILGHEAGDDLLSQVARRLQASIPPHDTAARLGGDEFVLIHRMTGDHEAVAEFASHLVESLNRPYQIGEQKVSAAASIGIAIHPKHGTEQKSLLRNADMALFRAKAEGRGNFVIFSHEVREENERREAFKSALAQGIRDQTFSLHWVPIRTPDTRNVEAYEALLCWKHPEDGLIPLADFMDVVEELGFAEQLTYILFRDACREAHGWAPHIGLSLSLCLEQITCLNLGQILRTTLTKSGLTPQRLKINLYETRVRARQTRAMAAVASLEETYGVRFCFDDIRLVYSRWKNGPTESPAASGQASSHTPPPAPA